MLRAEHKSLEIPERQSLAMLIFEQLERMILSGILRPGEPINERALSESNGLSRAPIREACRRLEQAGLVEIVVNRGAFVRTITKRAAEELCEVRLVLARHAGRLAVECMSDADIGDLARIMSAIEAAIDRRDLPEFYRLNHDFHMRIIRGSGNERLAGIYEAVNKELSLFRWRALKGGIEHWEAATAHREIVEALEARNVEDLLEVVQAHLEAANRRLLRTVVD
jgi:DNA-binding GntR family transcriptional regulator